MKIISATRTGMINKEDVDIQRFTTVIKATGPTPKLVKCSAKDVMIGKTVVRFVNHAAKCGVED